LTKNSQFQSFSVRSTLNQHSWWRHANVDTPMSPFEASLFLNWCTSLACSYSMGWRIGLNPDEEGADAATVDCCSSVDGRKVFLRRGDDVVSAFGTAAAPTNTLFLLKRVCSGCSSLTICQIKLLKFLMWLKMLCPIDLLRECKIFWNPLVRDRVSPVQKAVPRGERPRQRPRPHHLARPCRG